MTAHLIESTIVLAAALGIAQLPRLAARTRFAIVYAALLKFAIPSAIVPRLLSMAGITFTPVAKGTIFITMFGAATTTPVTPASRWPAIAMTIWALVAIALFVMQWLRGRRAVAVAMKSATVVDAGILRSSSVIAPMTAGVIKPVIVIPENSSLSDGELAAIVAHERAHIARRDNLLGLIELVGGCALWFHPLVWIARRVLAAAREEACDEAAVAAADRETYVSALAKICRAAVAPRVAGISCIAGARIKQRMEAVMRLNVGRALPHRLAVLAAATLILGFTAGTGVLRAMPASNDDTPHRYELGVSMTRDSLREVTFHFTIIDTETRAIVHDGKVQTRPGVPAEVFFNDEDPRFDVRFMPSTDASAEWSLIVKHGDAIVERMAGKMPVTKPATDVISLDFLDADLADVIKNFGKLANKKVDIGDNVHAKVTMSLHDVPWRDALAKMVKDAGYTLNEDDDTLHVH